MKYKIRKYFRKLFYLVMFFTCLCSCALADENSGRDDVVITSEPNFYMNCNGYQYPLQQSMFFATCNMDDGTTFEIEPNEYYHAYTSLSTAGAVCSRSFSVTETVDADTSSDTYQSHTIRIENTIKTYLMHGWSGMYGSSLEMENPNKWNVNMLGQYLISVTSAHGGYYTITFPMTETFLDEVPLYYRITLDDGTVVVDQTLYLENLADSSQQFFVNAGQSFTINVNMTNRQRIAGFVEGTLLSSTFDIFGDSSIALPTNTPTPTPSPATLNDISNDLNFSDEDTSSIDGTNNGISNAGVNADMSDFEDVSDAEIQMTSTFETYIETYDEQTAELITVAFDTSSIQTPLLNISSMFDTWFSKLGALQIVIYLSFLLELLFVVFFGIFKSPDRRDTK